MKKVANIDKATSIAQFLKASKIDAVKDEQTILYILKIGYKVWQALKLELGAV